MTPEELKKLANEFGAEFLAGYKAQGKVIAVDKGAELEAQGWKVWLLTLFPFWFAEDFSDEHIEYWEKRWSVLHRIKKGEPVENHELVTLLILGRGLGKSAVIEAARIMRGAILGKGYSLIISETDDQATEHVGNCRILIEHPDSKLLDYYPEMAIADNSDAMKGMPTADRQSMFICKNGYILRAKGLSAKMRGLRVGIHRPDDLAFDDIDDVNDSLAVSQNKLRLITSSILPVQARENVTVDFGQNLIGEHSVINQIRTGRSDALAERTIVGVANAFTHLEIDSSLDETGKLRHKILEASIPSWKGLNIRRAQKFLDDSGLQTFKAEYQNEFDQFRSGRVIPEYNEDVQIISWSEFEYVYGERRIPRHWHCKAGLDVGYSEGQYPHYSAWNFFSTSSMNSPHPGFVFLYRSRSFSGTSIDDQAESVRADMWDGEYVNEWQMSHERTGEMMTLNQKHDFLFSKFRYYKAEDGVAQWRHLSRIDPDKQNPFTGELGSPLLFYIVDDDQIKVARDDNGLKLFRDQVSTWEYVPVKITEQGQTIQKPSKVNDDHCDCAKGILALFGPYAAELPKEERRLRDLEEKMPEAYKNAETEQEKVNRNLWLQKQSMQEQTKLPSQRSALDRFRQARGR